MTKSVGGRLHCSQREGLQPALGLLLMLLFGEILVKLLVPVWLLALGGTSSCVIGHNLAILVVLGHCQFSLVIISC